MKRTPAIISLVALVVLAGCGGSPPEASEGTTRAAAQPSVPPARTLTMAVRYEVNDLAPKIPGSNNPSISKRLFNAQLALVDATGISRPYMAQALPAWNAETWRVFPDGRMETTYRLRPGLSWQDGPPLTAEDFGFAYRVYTAPGLSLFQTTPQDLMESVVAADPGTVVVRWRTLYPGAGALIEGDLEPLPRHILEAPFAAFERDSPPDSFIGHPFWTFEYIGAGPYRLDRWEPGSHYEGTAFDGHALGRPKIDRIVVRIIQDENTTLTNVLAGNLDYAAFLTLRLEHAVVLQRDWVAAQKGVVLLRQGGAVTLLVQMRPDYVEPAVLLDVRVRRALAHSIDRQALNDGVFEGRGFPSESFVPTGAPHYADVDRAIAKYPYDPRRAEQLMSEAGFGKDREGFFVPTPLGRPAERDASRAGERVRFDFRATSGTEFERMQAIQTDLWRRAGFEPIPSILPVARARDTQTRLTFPAISSRGGLMAGERTWTSFEAGSAANRWVGENRGGWSNSEYDRLWEAFATTMDGPERTRQLAGLMQLLSEQVPVYMLYFSVQIIAHVAALRGPEAGLPGTGALSLETLPHWNIHDWELR